MSTANPVLVEVVRGAAVESFHRGAACVVDAGGHVLRQWGDIAHPICPRSSIKPFQAMPLLESGAADAFKISVEELALACASHNGEPMHTERIAAWLARIGLNAGDLACGCQPPAGPLHHNCSGKHTGFLTTALHSGAPVAGYTELNHPVQQGVLHALAGFTGIAPESFPPESFPIVRDGCSAVNVYLPLRALALACARFGIAGGGAARIIDAMKAHPLLMSGTGRPCAAIIPALNGRGIVKTGAEGVYVAILPEQGLGVALKIDDGAGRAATVALVAILEHLGAFKADAAKVVEDLKTPVQRAVAGGVTGVIRPAEFI